MVKTRFHTSNLHDDWPMAELERNAVAFYAEDRSRRGTTGASPNPAVVARRSAVATLVRCKINGEGGDTSATPSSNLILCDCDVDRSAL